MSEWMCQHRRSRRSWLARTSRCCQRRWSWLWRCSPAKPSGVCMSAPIGHIRAAISHSGAAITASGLTALPPRHVQHPATVRVRRQNETAAGDSQRMPQGSDNGGGNQSKSPGLVAHFAKRTKPTVRQFPPVRSLLRYRSIQKLQVPRASYQSLLGSREDTPQTTAPLTSVGTQIPTELTQVTMYQSYQGLLDTLAERQKWPPHRGRRR
jgi:hypothetical protein